MYNQFRTTLLNLAYASDPNEHIPSEFGGVELPPVLATIYNILFPPNTSRFYKNFLAHSYLQLIMAAGLEDTFTLYDSRITYDVNNHNYFKIYRNSNPIVSNAAFPIFISGKYSDVLSNTYYYDRFLISQIDNSSTVSIYSIINQVYLVGAQKTTDVEDAAIPVIFLSGDVSEPINIGSTGLNIKIGGLNFTGSSDKTWDFVVEAPYSFNFKPLIQKIKNDPRSKELFNYRPDVSVTKYENLYNDHFNTVYQLAGYLVAYVIKCS